MGVLGRDFHSSIAFSMGGLVGDTPAGELKGAATTRDAKKAKEKILCSIFKAEDEETHGKRTTTDHELVVQSLYTPPTFERWGAAADTGLQWP